jgi:hypothetical protein
LERAVRQRTDFRERAAKIFVNLRDGGDTELIPYWLRVHLFAHGLFGHNERDRNWFLTEEQTKALALDLATGWRTDHLSGRLIPCRWDLQPVYTMIDVGTWDEPCRKVLDEALKQDEAVDGFTLMLFGGPYSTDRSMIEKMCNVDAYIDRARNRLTAKVDSPHETVRVAIQKLIGRDVP